MVNPQLAQQLKSAGLEWQPVQGDSFTILDQSFDGQVFMLNECAVMVQMLYGLPTITFHGSVEWALDTVELSDVVWLLSETQVRETLERHLDDTEAPGVRLQRLPTRYHCGIVVAGSDMLFAGNSASDAYGEALLHLLKQRGKKG